MPILVAGPGDVCAAAKVRRLARRVTQIYDAALHPFGLTIGQFGLLNCLGRRHGIGIAALADRLASDASTVSRLLKPVVSAGLVTITVAADDRRSRVVRLTDSGYQRRQAAAQGWEQAQAQLATTLGDGRLAALRFIVDDAHALLANRLPDGQATSIDLMQLQVK